MKSVLISINPRWCELIASGKKTVEVRKTRPKLETPFKVYIYCTANKNGTKDLLEIHGTDGKIRKANGKVIGEFVCDKIYQYSTTENCEGIDITDEEMTKASCLTKREIRDYEFSAEAKDFCIYKIGVYGWHISDLVIYDKPRELSEFKQVCKIRGYHKKDEPKTEGINIQSLLHSSRVEVKYFTRPPQSWAYTESEAR